MSYWVFLRLIHYISCDENKKSHPVDNSSCFGWSILKVVRTHFAACGGEDLAKKSESKS